MKFTTTRDNLLKPLQLVTGVVERRQTLPVLQNILVAADENGLSLRGTDMEVEMVAQANEGVTVARPGQTTISARKLSDIWRALPDGAEVSVEVHDDRAIVRSGRSRFTLSTLPASDFPGLDSTAADTEFNIPRGDMQRLVRQTSFAMAQQDVRFYLNGMLLEVTDQHIRSVATDAYRLAMCTLNQGVAGVERIRAVVPRKGVLELARMVADNDEDVHCAVGKNYLRARQGAFSLGTRLLDATYPDYENVIPPMPDNRFVADRETLRSVFGRVGILSNEKYPGVRLGMEADVLTVQANNPEQEEAEEELAVEYGGEKVEIGFNVAYLQDILGVLDTDSVRIAVSDSESSALIDGPGAEHSVYVLMPMNL